MNETIKHDLRLRIVKLLNILFMTAVFTAIWVFSYGKAIAMESFYRLFIMVITFLFLCLYSIFGRTYDAFQISYYRISEMIYSQALALLFSDALMYFVTWLIIRELPGIHFLLIILVLQIVISVAWCCFAHKWYFRTFPPRKTIIIYDLKEDMNQLIHQYGLEKKFCVEKTVHINDVLNRIELIDSYKVVFFCGVSSHERNIVMKRCVDKGITVFVVPHIGDAIMSSAQSMHIFHLPVLRVDRYKPTPEYVFIKRAFDMILSGAGLLILSPLMIIVAIMIVRDGGPALYRQIRLTQDGRRFGLLKFRSMRVDAEKDGVARLSSGEKDDRITPVGKVIRRFRIDELPQLVNIFLGDMSIVGPRPERPEIARQYEKELPEFRLRLQAKAGLTGLAQIYGKYNTKPYEKLMMDLMYIAHPSIIEDLKIIFATVKILFIPESTEGVESGQITALNNDSKQ